MSEEPGMNGLIAAVATLSANVENAKSLMERIEGDQKTQLEAIKLQLDKIDRTVHGAGGHNDWINARKRDGWWLGAGLIGLGTLLSALFDWWKGIH